MGHVEDFNALTSDRFRADPYPILAHMREAHPIYHLAPGLTESWHVFRYDDARQVLLSPDLFSSDRSMQGGGDLADANLAFLFNNMISASGERHRRLRMIANRAFMAKSIEGLRPVLQAVVDERMKMALSGAEFDLVEDFAAPVTTAMICDMLGLPREDMAQIRRWTAVLGDNSGAVTWLAEMDPALAERGRRAAAEMTAYFRDFLSRPDWRGDALFSALRAAGPEEERLTEDELLSMAMLLLLAGNETTTNLITNFVRLLDAFPDQAARLRADPTFVDGAIEETLRMRNSIRNVDRFALEDVDLHGVTIPRGGRVVVWLTSANRDPRVFDAPDQFRPDRGPNRHIAFGQGAHMCLGSALARMEARVAAHAIVTRTRQIDLTAAPVLGVNANFDNITRQLCRFHPLQDHP
ncbi:cytochrome P450 [Marivivens marinus]|uniref:cytochrome P450 n=1 Tax=Marivivens marinus TaxID=3110173 RepID=UPI003B849619